MCNVSKAVCELTQSEYESLERIGTGSLRGRVPHRHADKLIKLGFVEVSFGQLAHTPLGRRALQLASWGDNLRSASLS